MIAARVDAVLAVFGPIFLVRFAHVRPSGYIFTVLKQFGTGVIISTAFVHVSPALLSFRVMAVTCG